jgi:glycosyltransferase involved in cell wall biosynthesis
MKRLTIATTVYNRANLINNLYESLKRQTSKDFVWIIVDDGSNDNIDEVVAGFNADFEIIYLKQRNKGKCSALNLAADSCQSELFFVVDSDDYLKDDAVAAILHTWSRVCEKNNIVGIVAYRCLKNGKLSGKKFPDNKISLNYNILNYHYNQDGETALIFRSKYVKKYKHRVFDSEKFLSEEIQYNEIAQEGDLWFLRKALIVMDYLEDGLTKNYLKNWIKNPMGTKLLLVSKYRMLKGLNIFDVIVKRVKTLIQYDVMCMYSEYFKLSEAPSRILAFICFPLALALKPIYFCVK